MADVEKKNGFGITSLCLAIPGIIIGLIPLFGMVAIILGALGLIFGALSLGRVWRGTAGKWISAIPTLLSAVALALGIWGTVIVGQTVNEINDDFNEMEQVRDLTFVASATNGGSVSFSYGDNNTFNAEFDGEWTRDAQVDGWTFGWFSVTSGMDGGEVSCKILDGDEVVSEEKASGQFASVSCDVK